MKVKHILLIFLVPVAMACQDFMNPESLSTHDTKYIYANADDARKGVNAVYSYFGQDAFRSRLSNNMTGNTDIEHASGWSSSSDRYQIWDLNALPSNADLNIVWSNAYRAIRDANIAIEGIEASPALKDVSASGDMYQLLGEAFTLRAYWYSMLIFHFGDVPFVKDAPVAGADFLLPKEDRNVILDSVIHDMINVEARMQWADNAGHGIEQVNREYTLGMIARLALQRGGWYLKPDLTMARADDYLNYYKIARDYTQKLITLKDRPLPGSFQEVFMNECKFKSPVNSDVLFEVPFALGNGDVGWNIGLTVVTGKHAYGGGNNYMAMPPTYYFSFDTLDSRRDVTCGLYEVSDKFEEVMIGTVTTGGPLNISQAKWSRYYLDQPPGAASSKGTGINWPMLRYADVLLMFAEAENELNGPTSEAQDALRRVRQRAFDGDYWIDKVDGYIASVSGSKESFFDALVDERAWEFGGEMIRKYELIRWGIYSQKMKETVDGLKAMADGVVGGTSNLPDYLFWKRNSQGKFTLYNPNRKVPLSKHTALTTDGWTKAEFLLNLWDTKTVTYREWVNRDWANYTGGTVRYILPIPASEVAQGVIRNDGYGFGG